MGVMFFFYRKLPHLYSICPGLYVQKPLTCVFFVTWISIITPNYFSTGHATKQLDHVFPLISQSHNFSFRLAVLSTWQLFIFATTTKRQHNWALATRKIRKMLRCLNGVAKTNTIETKCNAQQFCGLKTWPRCGGSVFVCPALQSSTNL